MATTVVFLLLLLSSVRTVDLRTLSGVDIEKLNATIDGAKAKFSSAEYFYLDDPSPGDYFDSIATAAKILMRAGKERFDGMHGIVSAFRNFYKEASLITADQAAPLGTRECRLLPNQFRNCRIEPRIAGIMRVLEETHSPCKTFDIDSVLKMATNLMGGQCDKGLGEDGSIEQDMQRRMMQYAEANGYEGGSENKYVNG